MAIAVKQEIIGKCGDRSKSNITGKAVCKMKNEKNRKLKGSVLLTVVFVMAILIVFMFGTLSLALSASNRSHVNYSSAQTSVTARAVAESAISAIAANCSRNFV